MSIESQPLKLLPYRRRLQPDGSAIIETGEGETFEVSAKYKAYFDAVEMGFSVFRMSEIVPADAPLARFERLRQFLIILNDNNLIADRAYRRLADSLTSDYSWPTSFISTELVTSSIHPETKPNVQASPVIFAAVGLSALLGLWSVTLLAQGFAVGEANSVSSFRLLLFFFMTFWLGRSVQGLLWWFNAWASGTKHLVNITAEPFSVRLQMSPRESTLLGLSLIGMLSAVFASGFFAKWFASGSPSEAPWVAVFFAMVLLTELSPFTKTSLTEVLRSSRALAREGSESFARQLHVAISLSWVLLFGIFSSLMFAPALQVIWRAQKEVRGIEKVAFLLVLFVFATYFLSWLIDLLSAFSYESKTSGAIRRIWSRKSATPLQSVTSTAPKLEEIEKLPFVRQIDTAQRALLLKAAKVETYAEGQAICRQGENSRSLFIALEGRLAVAKSTGSGAGRPTRRKVIAFLEPGAVFGEAAFFFGHPRTADIVAMQESRVLCIPHDESMKTFSSPDQEARSQELQTRIWFLQALMRSDLFKNLPSEALDSILLAGKRQTFMTGQKIIREGEAAHDCFFLVQGQVSVTQNTKFLRRLNAGDAFGEIGVLNPGTLRTATVTAESDVIAISIAADKLWSLLRNHLALAVEIERMARARLKQDLAR